MGLWKRARGEGAARRDRRGPQRSPGTPGPGLLAPAVAAAASPAAVPPAVEAQWSLDAGIELAIARRYPDARQALERAIELFQAAPADPTSRRGLATALWRASLVEHALGAIGPAVERGEQARARWEAELARSGPGAPDVAADLTRCVGDLAVMYRAAGAPERAQACVELAVTTARRMVAEGQPAGPALLGAALHNLAGDQLNQRRVDVAVNAALEAVDLRQAVLDGLHPQRLEPARSNEVMVAMVDLATSLALAAGLRCFQGATAQATDLVVRGLELVAPAGAAGTAVLEKIKPSVELVRRVDPRAFAGRTVNVLSS